ncbi:MAG: glycoside hydrolase family 2 [Clostridia bacterium]|nr:glycoside hydrolase family 2 [Clostridia bacterium]
MRKYEDINILSENRKKQRAYYIPESGYTLLNGIWDFKFYHCDFEEDYIEKNWDKIDVPSCWQLKGYENPNYANVAYPYPYEPPFVPTKNPMGIYRREFEITDTNKRTYIVFEGVSSCLELYINDKYVGYTQGSHLQAEFDITDYVKQGINTVIAKVRKWCSGSYLEDQDFLRFNGIFRDVYILSRPEGHIKDINITTDDNLIKIKFEGNANISLFDEDKNLLHTLSACNEATFTVDNPVKWNAEKPYLYELVFEYQGEIIRQKIGFVTYEIGKDFEFLVNGTEVKLKGVNHHDTSPLTGWYMTDDDIRNDLVLMKKLNINTIRTSHYPPTSKFLDMCDELGFYVMLETDLETHGAVNREVGYPGYDCYKNPEWLCENPLWKDAFVDRMARAYHRDKNHTSVFSWSTGNESGHGENHLAMIDFIRSVDTKRLVHCEDSCRMPDLKMYKEMDLSHFATRSDVYSKMYPSIDFIHEKLDDPDFKRPFFMCEYSHAMGNGPGDVCDYWDLVYKKKNFIGGCVWEWADHTVIKDGVRLYGGDFEGEMTHDGNFCVDGMVFCDRNLKAGSLEVKAAYQYMDCRLDKDEIVVLNRYDFTNLCEYKFKYQVKVDGNLIEEKDMILDIEPKKEKRFKVKLPCECSMGAYISCFLYDKTGYEVARKQLVIPALIKNNIYDIKASEYEEIGNFIIFKGENYCYRFSKDLGTFVSLVKNGEEQLKTPIRITSMRAPTDNERHQKLKWYWFDTWQAENLDRHFEKMYSCIFKDGTITVEGSLSGVSRTPYFKYTVKYFVSSLGKISVVLDGKVKEKCTWLPRLGFEIKLDSSKNKFKYYGMGPYENYCDMNHASLIDMYESDAQNEYVDYVRPQEHGNHTKVKMLEFKNGLVFETKNEMDINVSEYSSQMLMDSKHSSELIKDGLTHVRIDYKHSGIGSASCGPEIQDKYKFSDKDIHFEFSIK